MGQTPKVEPFKRRVFFDSGRRGSPRALKPVRGSPHKAIAGLKMEGAM